jgi:hypothetical protein
MFDSMREELESTVAPLLKEILEDARRLAHQEAQLVRVEVQEEARAMRTVLLCTVMGCVAVAIGSVLAAFTLVYVIADGWLKAPLWVSFGVVSVVVFCVGLGLLWRAGAKLQGIRSGSEQTLRALREGFGWMQRTM